MPRDAMAVMAATLLVMPKAPIVRAPACLPADAELVLGLLADFALGLDGSVDGLTAAEFARAWRARFGSAVSPNRLATMRRRGLAEQVVCARSCAVTGVSRRPWVPVGMGALELACS